uniref:PARP catalytic domain-containing protein n=1 Tax=Zooxanthella nutricula TaxID=1333877 RepID=A0A7S2Q9G7_9DINO
MERFLEALDTYGENALVLGYHGTREDNLGSIFDRGFLLPGRYGVRVANGNAHGRGIYVAEEGAHTLSQHFLGGSSKMLVCGVIDSTLAPHEAARQDSSVWPKYTWRAGLLAHRAHRPSAAKAERARRRRAAKQQPALRGGVAFGAEHACVRHAGNAMVIFRPEHVAPLFVADGGSTVGAEFRAAAVPYDSRQFLQGDRAGGACNRADQPLRIGTRRCWNTERFSAVWLPGAAETTGHAIRAKRRLVCKARDMQRAAMRLDKACVRT